MLGKEESSLHALLWQVIRQHFIRHHYLLSTIGIHKGQPPVLAILWGQDGLTQKEIADHLKLKPPTVTAIIRRMERAGLVKREPDLEDMRISRVYLTEKGRNIKESIEKVTKILEEECFAGFTLEERVLLRRFFIQIRDNLKGVNEKTGESY